ncbi:hypothetical protein BN874_2780002 [Candidatus Contendobacter odensis Run_B_J11]|uniref:Uncharacterized protein n=1 Tax=Candidatus Contendobacter odensis Run_B_J11 TaxID=1400861 RepID=A0A7U7J4X8_9GAMM|nr:hypothetical protein BN874_2780002 [Candidatus Contendobacter odensis Run_B_J11]
MMRALEIRSVINVDGAAVVDPSSAIHDPHDLGQLQRFARSGLVPALVQPRHNGAQRQP